MKVWPQQRRTELPVQATNRESLKKRIDTVKLARIDKICTSDSLLHMSDPKVQCGIPAVAQLVTTQLETKLAGDGDNDPILLLDLPVGYALQTLEASRHHPTPVIAMTNSPCPEYWEDVWDLEPAALLMGIVFDEELFETICRVGLGERVRQLQLHSDLTVTERRLLRDVARGWTNARIARRLQIEEKTVRNMLTRVYTKLNLTNRVEATLYYWGRLDLIMESCEATRTQN